MADKISDEAAAAFLKELAELSKKHGIYIEGCGCCSSPALAPFEEMDRTHEGTYVLREPIISGWLEWRLEGKQRWELEQELRKSEVVNSSEK